MTTLVELEQTISHLEKISQQLHVQAVAFFPDQEFLSLDAESASVLEAVSDIKRCINMVEFNSGITALRFQLEFLEARHRQLEEFFITEDGAQLVQSVLSLQHDILQTKRDIHIRRHQDVNIVLDEKSNKLLEKYQLI